MDDLSLWLILIGTFLLSGTVKGVIGMGLPAISLGILTLTLDLTVAMALVIIPSLITNIWQACVGGHFVQVLKRIWTFLIPICLTIGLGTKILVLSDQAWISALLGALLSIYALTTMTGWQMHITEPQSRWLGPIVGAINGILTGMTGSFIVPGVVYMQALGMKKDLLIQAMGIAFLTATIVLGLSLQHHGVMDRDDLLRSSIAVIPALVGMQLGTLIRARVSEAQFRKAFLVGMLCIGVAIFGKAISSMT